MLKNLKKTNNKGFTIIEVMIVLAIAGLIMLVVFLAVPTLQRNQRNQGRRSDASRLASAANDFVSNSNGQVPKVTADATSIITAAGTLSNLGTLTGAPAAAAACAAGTAVAGQLTVCNATGAITFTNLAAGKDGVVLATTAQCGTAGGSIVVGSARQMSIVYTVETSGVPNYACINI